MSPAMCECVHFTALLPEMSYKTDIHFTRDIEIKNKLTITRGGEIMGWGEGKGHQGTCIKDPWTKPTGVGSRLGGGRVGDTGKTETTVFEQLKKYIFFPCPLVL